MMDAAAPETTRNNHQRLSLLVDHLHSRYLCPGAEETKERYAWDRVCTYEHRSDKSLPQDWNKTQVGG